MTAQEVSHGDLVDVMADIGQRPLDAAVPPGRVVVGHLQDECFNLIRDTGPSQLIALLATVKLLSDELFVPAHEGIRGGERGQRFETIATNWKGEGCETMAFGIGESDTSPTKLRMEGSILFQEIGNNLLLVAIDPAGDHGEEDLQNHGDSWGDDYRRAHSIEYTENPRDFNRVASADFFNSIGIPILRLPSCPRDTRARWGEEGACCGPMMGWM